MAKKDKYKKGKLSYSNIIKQQIFQYEIILFYISIKDKGWDEDKIRLEREKEVENIYKNINRQKIKDHNKYRNEVFGDDILTEEEIDIIYNDEFGP